MSQRDREDVEWSEAVATRACIAACRVFGLKLHRPPELIRLGTNGVFTVEQGRERKVVRVGPRDYDFELLMDQLALTTWLADREFPTSRPLSTEPIWIEERAVTFWQFLGGKPGHAADGKLLGRLLARLHALSEEYGGRLRPWQALGVLGERLDRVPVGPGFAESDRELLQEWRIEITRAVSQLRFERSPGLIHGDFHTGNIVVAQGVPHLVDFDRIAYGPREWDLAQIYTSQRLFNVGADFVDDVMSGYGWDLRDFEGVEALARLRALFQMCWLLTLPRTSRVVQEIENRMHFWRDPATAPVWRPL